MEAGQQQADKVDQDVTDWQTLKRKTKPMTPPMTQGGKQGAEGSKSRKTIQIFVRNGSMESPKDVSLSDKVGDVTKRIPNSAWQQA